MKEKKVPRTEPLAIEPGLLATFRLLTAIRLGLTALASLENLGEGPLGRYHTLSPRMLLSLVDGIVLWLYLSWPALQRRMGRFYLPVALGLATVSPVIAQYTIPLHMVAINYRSIIRAWQLLPVLLIPLVMIAWQYNFRYVLGFCIGTLLLDIALVRIIVSPDRIAALLTLEGVQIPVLVGVVGVIVNRTAIFVAVGFMVNRLMKTQRTQRTALLEANLRLTHYAGALEQLTISRERNRLAREMHDTLAHTLSALAVQLGAVDALWDADPVEAHALLAQSLTVTRTGLTETRRALHDLRASPLDDLGLTLALRGLAESLTARNGLAVDVDIPPTLDDLPPAVEQCLYRVAQEALENVTRHAAAQHVVIRLERAAERVVLTVQDDGQGFDPATADTANHLGLRGMRERAEMVGGILAVESHPGQGTTVRLSIG
ncbi:MAG TPA: sensor histidine kinase [Anaerolineae bacterium]|nr:sensor histidine kinase [Anaerolineae bacterium]